MKERLINESLQQAELGKLKQEEKDLLFRFFNLSVSKVLADGRIVGVLRAAGSEYFDGLPDKSNLYYVEIDGQGKIAKSNLVNFKPFGSAGEVLIVDNVEDDRSSQDGLLHGVTAVVGNNLWYPAVYYNDSDWKREIPLWVLNNLPPGKNTLPIKHQGQDFVLYRPESTSYQIWGYRLERRSFFPKNDPKPDFVWSFLPNWWTQKKIGLVSAGLPVKDGKEFFPIHGQYVGRNNHIYYALGGCLVKIGESLTVAPFANPFLDSRTIEELVGRKLPQPIHKKTIIYSCGAVKDNDDFKIAASVGDATTFCLETPWSEIEKYIDSQGFYLPSWQLIWELQPKNCFFPRACQRQNILVSKEVYN